MLITILVFLLILSVLVLIHEAGHFFVAKGFGVKVEEFGFGFPPRALSIQKGETIYSINFLPIGGFVKLYGEDQAGGGKVELKIQNSKLKIEDTQRAFFAKTAWQRALIIVAGVIMNFLLGWVILTGLIATQGLSTPTDKVTIVQIEPNSPAAKAGLKTGEVVLTINKQPINTPAEIIAITQNNLGKPLTLLVKDKNSLAQQITLIPRTQYKQNQGAMGIAIAPEIRVQHYSWYILPWVGFKEALSQCGLIVQGLGVTVWQLIVHQAVPKGLAGPIGIAQLTGQFIQIGPAAVFSLVALLSLNLAVLNILPIPALDGGRLFFILVEVVSRKKVHPKFEAYAHTIGMVLLLLLIAVITFHDLMRIITGQPLLPPIK